MRITDVRFALMRLSLFIDSLTPEDRQNLTENLLAKSGFAHIPTDRAFGTFDDEGVDVVEALDRAAYILNDLTPEEETSYQADEELKPAEMIKKAEPEIASTVKWEAGKF